MRAFASESIAPTAFARSVDDMLSSIPFIASLASNESIELTFVGTTTLPPPGPPGPPGPGVGGMKLGRAQDLHERS